MGGQDGFSRAMLNYDTDSNSVIVGFRLHPDKKFDIGFNLAWVSAEAAIAPFELPGGEFAENSAAMAYDFSQSWANSDLDTTRLDAVIDSNIKFSNDIWLVLRYRYSDYEDDAPYLYDTSGNVSAATAAIGWNF